MRTQIWTVFVVALLVAAGCDGPTPTQPSSPIQPGPPPPISTASFEVTGIVTDERGAPMSNASVTMAHYVGVGVQWPSVLTDGSGSYRITFTATPLRNGFVARAQVVADGYEEYWRSLKANGRTTLVESFRLNRLARKARPSYGGGRVRRRDGASSPGDLL
jgi:hypothetical protein